MKEEGGGEGKCEKERAVTKLNMNILFARRDDVDKRHHHLELSTTWN